MTQVEPRPKYVPPPPYRPAVDAAHTQTFGRPAGVTGSFFARPGETSSAPAPTLASPDPVLREAFSRPEGRGESLQRDPHAVPTGAKQQEPAPQSPWRDPAAVVGLGEPAHALADPLEATNATRLDAREVLFGGKVSHRALATLALLALAVGAVGGLVGRYTAEVHQMLTDSHFVNLPAAKSSLDSNSERLEQVVAQFAPAVVTIESVFTKGGDKMKETGSGVVYSGQGYIVTNNHVVADAADPDNKATLDVIFSDGTRVPSEIVGRDPQSDLAVVKVEVGNLTVAKFADSSKVRIGERVIAFGAPLGLSKTVTNGIVSAQHRAIVVRSEQNPDDSGAASVIDAVQTDAAINHGNSGGPLVDMNGDVVGINTMIISPNDSGSIGLGFAIPADDVRAVAAEVIQGQAGSVERPSLAHPAFGVVVHPVINDQGGGVTVDDLKPDGPAAAAGVQKGDVIVKVGDRVVSTLEEFLVAVRKTTIGRDTTVEVLRGEGQNKPIELHITPTSDKNK